MQEYAETANDQELMEFVVSGFEWARDLGTNLKIESDSYDEALQEYYTSKTPGCGLIGFFPEWTNSPERQTSETCEVADMIALAMRLSEAGVGDYWDDADRWIRNMLAEGQLRSVDWVYPLSEKGTPVVGSRSRSVERVPERNLGAFAGIPSANDWYGRENSPALGHCCLANGSKVLYWIWERILRYQDGKLRVNLLLNRASKWADIDSYIPYQGRVDVKIKKPLDLSVRIPEWVHPEQVRCQVDNKERTLGWQGRYAQVGSVKPGSEVTMSFPIFERTDTIWVEKKAFTLIRKGNEVVSIDPPGRNHPLYQREHYRDDTPRFKKITRFVADQSIAW